MEFESNYASELFDQFLSANSMRVVIAQFSRICNFLELEPSNFDTFYPRLKNAIQHNWKAQTIFNKLDKKASNKIYLQNHKHEILKGQNCLIIGGGPCGLRTAIELQLLGADHVLIVEKRNLMSRNNVIHLWPFVIHDLKELAGKKLNAKFCSGSIDHVSIRQLQMMLLKIALILGCDFVDNVAFEKICPLSIQETTSNSTDSDCCCFKSHQTNNPQSNNTEGRIGAYAHFKYNAASDYPSVVQKLDTYTFNILIGADGRRNLLSDYFPRKEFKSRLAIAITANFVNNHTLAEAQVPEISGISFIYYQQLFKSLNEQTNIDLENICYYKDDSNGCHYFVSTPKKSSLLARGVLIEDFQDTRALLAPSNVDQKELLKFARDTAIWTTGLDNLKFALNHYGQEDIAMFDFSTLYSAQNACRVKEIYARSKCCREQNVNVRKGQLLLSLVGDSLLEPFWPTGSGCGRGFLSSLDAAWFCRQYAIKCLSNDGSTLEIKENEENILSVISERESIYRLLAQTKPENLNQNLSQYTLNPATRYPNLNSLTIMPNQCKHLLYSNVRKSVQNRQTLAEKRARRITIACTPDTSFNPKSEESNTKQTHQEIEECCEETSIEHRLNNNLETNATAQQQNKQEQSAFKTTGIEYLNSNKHYMTPSAFNLATLERSRNKEIESVIRHRKQREERLNIECLSSEERFMNHIRKQIKPKENWLHSKTENSYESNTSSNRSNGSNNSSQEDLPGHFSNQFSGKVRDLEYKLNSHNTFNEERYLINNDSNRIVDGVNVMIARLTLQDLLDPIKQEAKFKEEVKRKAFLEKDYKYVGKLTKNDWNLKPFNEDKDDDAKTDRDKLKPRPKERIAIFKEKLHNIEHILINGKSKTDDEVNRLTKKQLQKFETRSGNRCGSWIEKLKSELSDKQQSTHKKYTTKRPLVNRKSFDDDNQRSESSGSGGGDGYVPENRNVHYIKYEKLNKPIVTLKQNGDSKFHSLDRIKQTNNNKYESNSNSFKRIESNPQISNAYVNECCARCKGRVLTIEKLNINGLLFHRNCLKCINCGCNLRLQEIRQTNNVIDEKNCVCTLCSTDSRLLARSNSISNYNSRLKERMRSKESFLLNLDNLDNNTDQKGKTEISERVEYENSLQQSNARLVIDDEEDLTKLLNQSHQTDSKSSQSSDTTCAKSDKLKNSNSTSSEEEEDDEETSDTTDTSDTTGADINSLDAFDISELESPKSEKSNKVPEIVVEKEDDDLDTLSTDDENNEDDEKTLNDTFNTQTNQISKETTSTSTLNNNRSIVNLIDRVFCQTTIPEKSKTISDISEVDEFDELTDSRLSGGRDGGVGSVEKKAPISFKVEIPKLFNTDRSATNQKMSKDQTNDQKRPVYQGAFTERCKSVEVRRI